MAIDAAATITTQQKERAATSLVRARILRACLMTGMPKSEAQTCAARASANYLEARRTEHRDRGHVV